MAAHDFSVSEYQLYEFISVDRTLTSSQCRELRDISSRAEITSSSFRNEYNYGDLKADPAKLVARYFDVGVHITNWGTRRLLLRFPSDALDSSIKHYAKGATSLVRGRGSVVIDICPAFDGSDFDYDDIDQTSVASDLLSVRAAILNGDLRSLYFAWLAGVQTDDLEDGEREPPVPDGLGERTSASTAIVRFLGIDERLLKIAVKPSGKRIAPASAAPAIRKLPTSELRKIVERLATDPPGAAALLRRALRREQPASKPRAQSGARTVAELRTAFS